MQMRNESVIVDFANLAKSHGTLTAFEQGNTQVSYAELLKRSTMIAEYLTKLGSGPKDAVAISGVQSCGLYASILGVLLARGVILLIDPRLPQERIRFMMKESGCHFLIHVAGTESELSVHQTLVVEPASASVLEVKINHQAVLSGPSICQQYESPAYIFCTSGTTAKPRLVLGSHPGLAHFIQWQRETFHVGSGDKVAQLTGLSFDVVLRDIFLPLTSGATLCLPDTHRPLAPSAVLSWMQAARISRLHTVPTLAQSWLNLAPAGMNLPRMRTVFFAGEPLTDALVARWRERLSSHSEVVNLYGPTETTLAKFFYRVPPVGMKEGIQPVGKPLPKCEAFILDEACAECAQGIAGQIAIATNYGTYGYLNAPEESVRKFRLARLRDGREARVFLTGDLGKISPSGELHILGRIDNQVKINGIRVELEEISAVAAKYPGVESAVTVAFEPNGPGKKLLCLYWTPSRSGQLPSVATLRKFLATYLPEGIIPSLFMKLESFPVTPNGKIDRSLLPEPKFPKSELLPQTEAEKQLLPIWEEVLRKNGGVPGPDFFSSGGTSLSAVELQLQIEEVLGVGVSTADIFDDPSFKNVASLIAQRNKAKIQLPAAPVMQEYPLLPSQRAFLRFQYADEGRTWNNITRTISFKGHISAEMMKQALMTVIKRHQNLLITFHFCAGRWMQKLNAPEAIHLRELDLRHLLFAEQQPAIEQVQKRQSQTILPPGMWPLFAATLVYLSESETKLVFTSSHLVSDALSHEIIAQELNECVRCLQQGIGINLPALERNFLDYVMWRLGQSGLNPKRDSLHYWLEVFSGYSERLELPLDGDPTAGASAAGYKRWLPADLSGEVRRLSADLNCSAFIVIFSAFAISLHRLSGRNTIVLKTVADGRPYPFLRKWVGNFAAAVHVRSEVRSDTTFLEFTKAIQRGISEAVKHQECEFLEILETLGIPVEADRIPLASIFLNPVEEGPATVPAAHEEHCDDLGFESKADIMAHLRRTEPLIEMDVHYRKGLYSRKTVSGLLDCFQTTLQEMTLKPMRRIVLAREAVA